MIWQRPRTALDFPLNGVWGAPLGDGVVHGSHNRLWELDGLRGLAALSVFFIHASVLGLPWRDFGSPVVLFFVLSGFVLARSLLSSPQSYRSFIWRRIVRLYPAYWATLLFALLLMHTYNPGGLEGSGLSTDWAPPVPLLHLVKHFFLITPGISLHRIDFPIWSLVVEMRISLLFPLLLAAFISFRPPVRFIVSSLTLGLAFLPHPLLGIAHIPIFLLGIALAVHVQPAARPPWIVGPLLLLGIGLYFVGPSSGLGFYGTQYLSAIGAAMIIVSAMSSDLAKTVLTTTPVRFLGDISYSFYLLHLPILIFVTSWLYPLVHSGTTCLLASLGSTIAVAVVFRYCVELPAMRCARPLWQAPEVRYGSPTPARP
jgi:peptidoglycan/LPS O-acetylase OafA/YrhL